MKNKHGLEIEVGTEIIMPDPEPNDIWQHSFTASVTDIISDKNIIVEDQDADMFEIDPNRIEELA